MVYYLSKMTGWHQTHTALCDDLCVIAFIKLFDVLFMADHSVPGTLAESSICLNHLYLLCVGKEDIISGIPSAHNMKRTWVVLSFKLWQKSQ